MNERKRTNPWVWVSIGCSVLIAGAIAFVAFILFVVVGAMRSSIPYQDAMQRAQSDPRVIAALGSPVEPGLFISGSIKTRGRDGDVDISVPIHGPKGKADISVEGTKDDGKWTYTKMLVIPRNGGEPIDLLPSTAESPSTAPPGD